MDNKSSITSLMSAFARAYHSENCDDPIFKDNIIRHLISDEEYEQISSYIIGGFDFFDSKHEMGLKTDQEKLNWVVNTQLAPTPIARARFCEESLETSIKTGNEQYVILGAGLDTFAWRKPELLKIVDVFEVDHPLTQEDKIMRLRRSKLEIPENLHFVRADFRKDDLKAKLKKSGYDKSKKTFFSLLGVSFYLSEEELDRLIADISSFAAEGSAILFDYGDEGLFSAKESRVKNMLAMAVAAGEQMKYCASEMDLSILLEKRNFLIFENLTPDDINRKYFLGRSDGLSAFEHVSYALAVIKNTQFRDTKEEILNSALSLFSHDGFKSVSVKDIADTLSITKGALYRHYKSKQDIFDSILNRMEILDQKWARENEMPEDSLNKNDAQYKKVNFDNIEAFCIAQFDHWTREEFPSSFRKMITVGQYKDDDALFLYQQYFSGGPVRYIEDIFRSMMETKARKSDSCSGNGELVTDGTDSTGCKPGKNGNEQLFSDAKLKAIQFYAPMYLLYSMYDGAENKEEIKELLYKHLDNFKIIMESESENCDNS